MTIFHTIKIVYKNVEEIVQSDYNWHPSPNCYQQKERYCWKENYCNRVQCKYDQNPDDEESKHIAFKYVTDATAVLSENSCVWLSFKIVSAFTDTLEHFYELTQNCLSGFINDPTRTVFDWLVIDEIFKPAQTPELEKAFPAKIDQSDKSIDSPNFEFHTVKFELPPATGCTHSYLTLFGHREICTLLWIMISLMSHYSVRREKHFTEVKSFSWLVKVLDLFLLAFKTGFIWSDVLYPQIENFDLLWI